MLLSFLVDALSMYFGALYPAFQSYRAIYCEDQQNILKWSKYWIVFALYLVFTTMAEILLISYIMPGFVLIKLAILWYIVSPWTNGAEIAYKKIAAPFFESHESDFDSFIKSTSSYLHDILIYALGNFLERFGVPLLSLNNISSFWHKKNSNADTSEYLQFNSLPKAISSSDTSQPVDGVDGVEPAAEGHVQGTGVEQPFHEEIKDVERRPRRSQRTAVAAAGNNDQTTSKPKARARRGRSRRPRTTT